MGSFSILKLNILDYPLKRSKLIVSYMTTLVVPPLFHPEIHTHLFKDHYYYDSSGHFRIGGWDSMYQRERQDVS